MKILIADDDPVSRRELEGMLKHWGYEVVTAADGLEASAILKRDDAPNLAILDWLMPGLDGVELCREIRSRRSEPYTYLLLLTCKGDKHDVVVGLEGGADDYVSKPFDPQELKVRLRTGKRILGLLDQLVAARDAVREMAKRDPLTGLWNRGGILEILETELARARRQGTPLGLAMVDIDHFKKINDTWGHLVGDQILREAARAMAGSVRPYDSAGRFGGEEFLLIVPGCDETNALAHAERLRGNVEKIAISVPGGDVRMTASFGVTVVRDPDPGLAAAHWIEAADIGLYRAKHLGRNRVEIEPARSGVSPT